MTDYKYTILDWVLIEEYNRNENYKACYEDELAALNGPEHRQKVLRLQNKIDAVEFEQKKIRAALDVAGIDINKHIEPRKLYNIEE